MGIRKKYIVIPVVILFLGAVTYAAFGFLPVLSVEGKRVSYGQFLKMYGAYQYYDKVAEREAAPNKELRKLVLQGFVEDILLDKLIQKTNSDFDNQAKDLVERAIADSKDLALGEATKQLYGLSTADFKKLILIPEAKKNLLAKHYETSPDELERVWNEIIQNADVKVYYPGYLWEQGMVKVK